MIIKVANKDFPLEDSAYTLKAESIGTHESGWTIAGQVHENYFQWVNEFEATHPEFGRVWGDFEKEVYADSEEAFQDFFAKHPPRSWDYDDI